GILFMSRHDSELTDEQWMKIQPLSPKVKPSPAGGRSRADDRKCFEGILWVLRSGARWKDLPRQYPSPSICWRRLNDWEEQGVWLPIWRTFLGELDEPAGSTRRRPSPTAASPRQKKGPMRRKDQTRKGYEVDEAEGEALPRGGKRPRCSSGSSTR